MTTHATQITTGVNNAGYPVSKDVWNAAHYVPGIFDVTSGCFGALGDGLHDDTPHIQAAIDAAEAAGGGVVYFRPGCYLINDHLECDCSNMTFHGDGYNSRIVAVDSNDTYFGMLHITAAAVFPTRISNITVRDLYFDHSGALADHNPGTAHTSGTVMIYGADNVIVDNVYVYSAASGGFGFVSCDNLQMANSVVQGVRAYVNPADGEIFGGNAINFQAKRDASHYTGVHSNSIHHCRVSGTTDNSWPTTFHSTYTTRCLQGNVGIYVNTGGYEDDEHLLFVNVTDNIIERCMFGIAPEGQANGGTGDIVIANNTIRYCDFGIYQVHDPYVDTATITSNRNTLVSGNRMEQLWNAGISMVGDRITITGNIISDWAMALDSQAAGFGTGRGYAISVGAANSANTNALVASGLVIANNVCRQNSAHDSTYRHDVAGVYVTSTLDHFVYKDVVIEGNVLDGGGDTAGLLASGGIVLDGMVKNVNVTDNVVTGFGGAGFFAYGIGNDKTLAPSHVSLRGNRIYDNNMGGTNYYSGNITIWSSNPYWTIENNEIYRSVAEANRRCAIRICDSANADVVACYVTIRNNNIRNFFWGDNAIVSQTTGTGVKIEGNHGMNYRTAVPSASGGDAPYWPVGSIVWNSAPTAGGTLGWINTIAGKPGTWKTFGAIAS